MSKDVIHDWLAVTGRHPVLAQEEVNRLTAIIQDPSSPDNKRRYAINKLVKHNLKAVVDMTLKFLRRRTQYRLTDDRIADYLQQGALGLIRAAEKYDASKGYKFSTYAYTWIRGYLGRHHYNTYSIVHIPENVVCALMNNNKPELKQFTDAARLFQNMDSLDRLVTSEQYEPLTLGDIVAESLYEKDRVV